MIIRAGWSNPASLGRYGATPSAADMMAVRMQSLQTPSTPATLSTTTSAPGTLVPISVGPTIPDTTFGMDSKTLMIVGLGAAGLLAGYFLL